MENNLSLMDDFNMKDDKEEKYFDKHIEEEIETLKEFELLNELVNEDKKNNA